LSRIGDLKPLIGTDLLDPEPVAEHRNKRKARTEREEKSKPDGSISCTRPLYVMGINSMWIRNNSAYLLVRIIGEMGSASFHLCKHCLLMLQKSFKGCQPITGELTSNIFITIVPYTKDALPWRHGSPHLKERAGKGANLREENCLTNRSRE
jgi:hypothetical protein